MRIDMPFRKGQGSGGRFSRSEFWRRECDFFATTGSTSANRVAFMSAISHRF